MPDRPTQILAVAHTHWDREWYHTAERFRQRLVGLVDELLDDPPSPGTSFLLDGQAVLLDDYLTVRPERAAELAALLRDGRLEAGPWYVLADELIPAGEALVRNLLAGRETVRRLRGEPPAVLYCPDSFGHPAVLPELATGFGCALVVLWRGYGGARWPAGDTVRWRGPTGQTVLLYHLPPDGYEFGSSLPTESAEVDTRWQRIASVLVPRAVTGVALLLNGADHHARQRDQARAVERLADGARPVLVQPSSLGRAADAIVAAARQADLPTITGELRDSYGYAWTLGGTLATRTAQKRRNARAERALLHDAEPWIALTSAGGSAGVRALLRAAWRDLLRGHPHDTLCGTSIDAVAHALDERLATAEVQASGLRDDALLTLLGHDAERARQNPAAWRPALLLRNRAARPRGGVAEVCITTRVADVAVGPGSAARRGAEAEPDDALPRRAGIQVVSRRRRVELTESPRAYPDADLVDDVMGLLWTAPLGGLTLASTPLDELTEVAPPCAVEVSGLAMDNGLLRVTVADDGAIQLVHLAAGRRIDDLLSLEHERDVGDLYTPAIRESLGTLPFSHAEPTLYGPLRGEITLRFTDGSGDSVISLRLQLDAGLAALKCHVDGTNRYTDVRLRARFALGVGDDARTFADAAFHPVERTPLVVPPADAAMEHVVRTSPLHRYVSRFGALGGATLVSDGLAEYESVAHGSVAVTLLRAVGELSRVDLPERPGHAGWPAPTPAAQGQGAWQASFAVALHGPDTPAQRDTIERLAEDVLLPLTGLTLRSNLLPSRIAGGLELQGEGLALSAVMPAQRAGWVVLRCVNRRAEAVKGRWVFTQPVVEAFVARLDETPGAALAVNAGGIEFDAAPMEIVTIVARP
jgi:mannosylglycerate hydrolase